MKKMRNPPLFYTVVQVKFNAIGQMGEYALRVQDYLRRHGYPDFRQITRTDLAFIDNGQMKPETQVYKQLSWNFINSDATEGYVLNLDSFIFHTTLYTTFEDFSNKFLIGLNIVHEIVNLSFVERIGLRYLNAISHRTDDNIADYLNSSLLGFPAIENGSVIQNLTETVAKVNNDDLVTRAIITESGPKIPRDLFPLQLKIQDKFSTMTGKSAVIDMDYSITQRFDFDNERIKNELFKFHNMITSIFQKSTSDYARKIWS